MEDMGLKFTSVIVRHLLGHLNMFGPIWLVATLFISDVATI